MPDNYIQTEFLNVSCKAVQNYIAYSTENTSCNGRQLRHTREVVPTEVHSYHSDMLYYHKQFLFFKVFSDILYFFGFF